ncbi:DNA repair protein RadC [Sandaracinobacter sp. RS1-74]|uniref:JAB domain-containing protein n=1 Tax=Sandaracinobacteroides sayramensis TaxID=2913411 RepID=UPI001EDAADC2|nr:DNA repair protein RadC [Sandaracinobacteroides sayramensis]MCG2842358.1 DNA repair protein RadC [Sandaracinobacteroides sayramensis]
MSGANVAQLSPGLWSGARLHSAGGKSPRDRWLLMRLLAAGQSTPRLADRLIDEQGSLGAILAASDERLRQLGADSNGIAILGLIRETLGAVLERSGDSRPPIRSGGELADLLHSEMAWLTVEQVRVAYLDAGRRLHRIEVLSTGTIDKAHIHPREIARRALELSATAVVLAHNHPSGDPTPSRGDVAITKKVAEALAAVEVELMDHLVIARAGTVSMAVSGLI